MSDTPRTDAIEGYHGHDDGSCVPADFARQLERELAELRKAYQELLDRQIASAIVHSHHPLRHYDRTCPACNQPRLFGPPVRA